MELGAASATALTGERGQTPTMHSHTGAERGNEISRRTVIRSAAAATLALLPQVLHAQPSTRVFRLGYIGLTAPNPAVPALPGLDQWDAFKDEMRAFGFIEGQNYLLERSYIEGREERIPRLVAEFLEKNVDVLITSRTDAAREAK